MPYNREVVGLPTIESNKTYAPDAFAYQIVNFQHSPDSTLSAVRGPCPYLNLEWSGRLYGVYHSLLDQGTRDILLVRVGTAMYEQSGFAASTWTKLHEGLTNSGNYKYPDQFCDVSGRIVWTNGYDSPLIYDGYIRRNQAVGTDPLLLTLGYDRPPSNPTVFGPQAGTDNLNRATNSGGYSHPGGIGTISSSSTAATPEAADANDAAVQFMLAGNWNYHVQYEDCFGNRSKLSSAGSVTVRQEQTRPMFVENLTFFLKKEDVKDLGVNAVTADDLTRQFWVDNISTGPTGTVARIMYRTPDTLHRDSTPRFLCRIPDNETTGWPDEVSDGLLGAPAVDYITVPTFKVMCPWQGGLAVGNTTSNQGVVWISDPGFPGSFRTNKYIYPDPNGSEVTGLAAFNGKLLAFTERNVYIIEEANGILTSSPLTNGIGCVAPSSIVATGAGALVWLGRDGFYAFDGSGVKYISDAIEPSIRKLSWHRASRSVAVYNKLTREYICAVTEAGQSSPNLLLCWDGEGWREQRHNLLYNSICATKDVREYIIGASHVTEGTGQKLVVLDHENRTYASPISTFTYKSRWLKIDGVGLTRFNAATLYVGFLESSSATIVVNCYRNGRWDEVVATGELTLVADDRAAVFSTSILGTAKTASPRLYWKRFDMQLRSVDSFSFELVGTPTDAEYINIAAFAFDGVVAADRGARISRG